MIKVDIEVIKNAIKCDEKDYSCDGLIFDVYINGNCYEMCETHLRETIDDEVDDMIYAAKSDAKAKESGGKNE